jgi:quinol monooxygenase YgiN
MGKLEVIAHMKIRAGELDGFQAQVVEIIRVTREKDTHTLRCDWFINENGTECEVHEVFPNEQGLIEHKMNTMEATIDLFERCAYDHDATICGDGSQHFINLVTERMGAPTVYALLQGLESSVAVWPPRVNEPRPTQGGVMGHLEVIARLKIRPGQLEGFKAQAAELVRLTREMDTNTLRYDWFINDDGTECEVHEAYVSAEGLVEHNTHIMEARAVLFRDYAFDHRMSAYGEISQDLTDLGKMHAGGIQEFSFLQGLEPVPAV